MGLGKPARLNAEAVRRAAAAAIQKARELQADDITIGAAGSMGDDTTQMAQAIAEGLVLGAYRYLHYRTELTGEQTFAVRSATLVVARQRGQMCSRGVTRGR